MKKIKQWITSLPLLVKIMIVIVGLLNFTLPHMLEQEQKLQQHVATLMAQVPAEATVMVENGEVITSAAYVDGEYGIYFNPAQESIDSKYYAVFHGTRFVLNAGTTPVELQLQTGTALTLENIPEILYQAYGEAKQTTLFMAFVEMAAISLMLVNAFAIIFYFALRKTIKLAHIYQTIIPVMAIYCSVYTLISLVGGLPYWFSFVGEILTLSLVLLVTFWDKYQNLQYVGLYD